MPGVTDPTRSQRIEIVLEQIEALPTLSSVALRVLELTRSPDADVAAVISLIESDPTLTARLLSLCNRADLGVRHSITTVDRAVVLLGLEAVRAALLSVEVCGVFGAGAEAAGAAGLDEDQTDAPALDRREFWRHAVGVACAAELIADAHADRPGAVAPQEAFLCGILHGIGKLALQQVLPRAYARVVALCEARQAELAEIERAVIGIDHHTAGKRLGEHWGLPHELCDVMWLYGQPCASLPDLPHRDRIAMTSVAVLVAQRLHLGWSGGAPPSASLEACAADAGLDPARVTEAETHVHERVRFRAETLGLHEEGDAELLLTSIARANHQLGRLNGLLQQRSRAVVPAMRALETISRFHETDLPRRSLADTMAAIVTSAAPLLDAGFYAFVWEPRAEAPWQLHELAADGRILRTRTLGRGPTGRTPLAEIAIEGGRALHRADMLGWLGDQVRHAVDPATLRILPMVAPWGPATILLHDGAAPQAILGDRGLETVTEVWTASLAAAGRYEGAKRLGEKLAEANRTLAETQAALVESRSMAALGELAAGAAHEMNNPLTVISGNAQMLARRVRTPEHRQPLDAMVAAADQLSGLLSSLHLFADPPEPDRSMTDIPELLTHAVRSARTRIEFADRARGGAAPVRSVRIHYEDSLPPAWLDGEQVRQAVTELIVNALEAEPRSNIEVHLKVDPLDDRLVITVEDDGVGMSEHALSHACDPFFSDKPAGRQTGLGLARARRLVGLHGGDLELRSSEGHGTSARILLPDWRWDASRGRSAA